MAYGMAGRSPKTGGPLQAPQQPLQRLSPGVYRGPEGNLVNARGRELPGQNMPEARESQPQGMAQAPVMGMKPPPGYTPMMPQMPQFGGMGQPPQQGGMMQPPQFNPFANYMAQQPQEMQKQFAQQMQQPQPMMRPAVMPTFSGMNGMFPYNK